MKQGILTRDRLCSGLAIVVYLALFKLFLHFHFNQYYGYMRDELYFIACGERLAFGYVDIGPLTPWLGRLAREILGESLFALRFFPAVAGALTVFLTGLLARQLGGGRFAQALAALTAIIAPAWLMSGNILALPSFEPFFWLLCANLIVRIIQSGNGRLWLWVGVVGGFGVLNKPSMLFFAFGLAVGLLATPQRKWLKDKWLWLGVGVAFLIALPYLLWQIAYGWPTIQFMAHLNRDIMKRITRMVFLAGQLFYVHPLNAPVWLAGLGYYLFAGAGRPYRLLGWSYLVVLALLLTVQSKIYYLAPAYPMLLAAGAVALESGALAGRPAWWKAAVAGLLVAGGLVTAPVGLPVLPIERVDGYVRTATGGLLKDVFEATGTWHDQFGWENQVATVAEVYHGLSAEERASCIIFARNFGEAGALDFYGPAYGLPKPVSIHQNYYLWGPPGDYELAIVYGVPRDILAPFFESIEEAAVITCQHCVERRVIVYVCRKPIVQLKDAWPMFRDIAFDN